MSVATSVSKVFCFSTKTLNELERIILIGFSFPLCVFFVFFSPFFSNYFATLPSLKRLTKS